MSPETMTLSRKAKESIKTALAMTITYGIALAMDFDKPVWGGFAVAFISLASVGQSLNKGAMRMLGTIGGALVAFLIFAFFIQQRWLFMLGLSTWVGFCTTMMMGRKNQYAWNSCGFVCVIICFDSPHNSFDIFHTALLRVEETGLGILIYTLVTLFLWPVRSGPEFEQSASKLVSIQHRLYDLCFDTMTGKGASENIAELNAQELQELNHFNQSLDNAIGDTTQIRERRDQWRNVKHSVAKISETIGQWQTDCSEIQKLNLIGLVPGLEKFDIELERRFTQIEGMLQNKKPEFQPESIDLVADKEELRQLSHFHKAELVIHLQRLKNLNEQTSSVFHSIQKIRGFASENNLPEKSLIHEPASKVRLLVLDPDRLTAFAQVFVTLWMAYLLYIYVGDLPGGSGVVSMTGVFGMAFAVNSMLPISLLIMPSFVSIIGAGILYLFVMPHLTGFYSLGCMIFVVTFGLCYYFGAPRQMLGRALALAMFLTVINISNQQTYSFLSVPVTMILFSTVLLLLVFAIHIPFSSRPEKVFLRLLTRFFRSSEFLVSTLDWSPQRRESIIGAWMIAYHGRAIAAVPAKLIVWSRFINSKQLPGTAPQDIQSVVGTIQILAHQVQEMVDSGVTLEYADLIDKILPERVRWNAKVEQAFKMLSGEPAAANPDMIRGQLLKISDSLELHVQQRLDSTPEQQFSVEQGMTFYRLLGVNRGLSEALLAYSVSAGSIDWAVWRESRF
jgi:uncharacterized membrane protein YccC